MHRPFKISDKKDVQATLQRKAAFGHFNKDELDRRFDPGREWVDPKSRWRVRQKDGRRGSCLLQETQR